MPFGWLEMVYDWHKSTDPEEVTKIINEKTWLGGSLAAFFDIDVDFERESFAAFVDFDFDFDVERESHTTLDGIGRGEYCSGPCAE